MILAVPHHRNTVLQSPSVCSRSALSGHRYRVPYGPTPELPDPSLVRLHQLRPSWSGPGSLEGPLNMPQVVLRKPDKTESHWPRTTPPRAAEKLVLTNQPIQDRPRACHQRHLDCQQAPHPERRPEHQAPMGLRPDHGWCLRWVRSKIDRQRAARCTRCSSQHWVAPQP